MHPTLQRIIHLLLPAVCVACRSDLPFDARALCRDCWRRMPKIRDYRLPAGARIDDFRAAGAFEGPLRAGIHAFKYGRKSYVAERLAELIDERCGAPAREVDFIAPVPSPWWRETLRGFNPAAALAAALSARWRIPVRHDLLARGRGKSQIGLNRTDRWLNAHRSFRPRKPVDLSDRTVLLVDDVCTSGATLSACAKVLRSLGARSVLAVAAARESGVP